MPETCKECIFSRYILGEWFCRTTTTLDDDGTELWESVGENGNFHRADFCPLVPIPPHGDLIDRDGIKWIEEEFEERCHNDRWTVVEKIVYKDQVDKLPTIIEAESDGE